MPTIFDSHRTSAGPHGSSSPLHKTKMGLLTSLAYRPSEIRFETQQDKEEIILFIRQHLIVLVPQLLIGLLMAVAPTILFPFFILLVGRLPVQIPVSYILVGTVFWYVATFGFLLATFLHWFFNIYIVTNRRIVDIDFVNLLYKEFTEAEIARIQDLTFTSSGIFAAIFNFGNVFIQTAGEVPNIEFIAVPQPQSVVKTISELLKRSKGIL